MSKEGRRPVALTGQVRARGYRARLGDPAALEPTPPT
jgi:hypothetical protein